MLNWNLDSCCGIVEITGPYLWNGAKAILQASDSINFEKHYEQSGLQATINDCATIAAAANIAGHMLKVGPSSYELHATHAPGWLRVMHGSHLFEKKWYRCCTAVTMAISILLIWVSITRCNIRETIIIISFSVWHICRMLMPPLMALAFDFDYWGTIVTKEIRRKKAFMLPYLNIIIELKKGNSKQFQIFWYSKILSFRQMNNVKLLTLLDHENF